MLGKIREALWFTIGFGFIAAFATREWVLALWPAIEFDFGPDHMNIEKQRRNRILALCATVVIPMLVTAGYELVKAVFFK